MPRRATSTESFDAVDRVVAEWRAVRPDLNPAPLEIVGRILVLATELEARVAAVLAPFGLTLGQFDILATLRRHPEMRMTPGGLLARVVLTSGGMTARLDKLESSGLIARTPDPEDRRGVVVTLTPHGEDVIDRATTARFAEAADVLAGLPARDAATLKLSLKTWLARLHQRG